MATAKNNTIRVKGPITTTPKGKSLFVSVPAASTYDPTKQEATIVLNDEDTNTLKATLQAFMDSPEVKESGIKDTGFVDALFKDDTDQDGNSTGFYRVKAKTSIQYPCKLYTANGTVFTPDAGFTIPNRSDIRLSVKPEVMKTSMFTGLVLRLQALKVIDMPAFDDGLAGTSDEGSFLYAPEGTSDSSESIGSGWDD